ncbi:hypothetical protein HDU93_006919 [Gonapodya sp. JEL0774]|nr:hypothetical protein HDU93_006919 [Gonapodya sp. JEL0774]
MKVLRKIIHPNLTNYLGRVRRVIEKGSIVKEMPVNLFEFVSMDLSMVTGIDYLHGRDVAHLDVKPANILVDQSGRIKFVDFGLSVKSRKGDGGRFKAVITGPVGTPNYMAPELCLPGGLPDGLYDKSVGEHQRERSRLLLVCSYFYKTNLLLNIRLMVIRGHPT